MIWQHGQHTLLPDELAAWQARATGRTKRLPNGFWGEDRHDLDGWQRGLACLRHLFVEIIGDWSRERLLHTTLAEIHRSGLGGFKQQFGCTIHAMISGAFPEYDIHPWEMAHVPHDYWQTGGEAVKIAALRWWLAREGMTARGAYTQLVIHRGTEIRRRINHDIKIVESGVYCPLRSLLRKIDPHIPPYLSRRIRLRQRASLRCPQCGKPVGRQVIQHLVRWHDLAHPEARTIAATSMDVPRGYHLAIEVAVMDEIAVQTITSAARAHLIPALRRGGMWWIDPTHPRYIAWRERVQTSPRHQRRSA